LDPPNATRRDATLELPVPSEPEEDTSPLQEIYAGNRFGRENSTPQRCYDFFLRSPAESRNPSSFRSSIHLWFGN